MGFEVRVSSPSYITQSLIILLLVPEQFKCVFALEVQPSHDIWDGAEHLKIMNP
jgi:hypothetical protein